MDIGPSVNRRNTPSQATDEHPFNGCFMTVGSLSTGDKQINGMHPLILQQNPQKLTNQSQDFDFKMLFQPPGVRNLNQLGDDPDGYQMARVKYTNQNEDYAFEFGQWKKEEDIDGVQKLTKPHSLRSVFSRAVTINDRLYIFHNLCTKDPTLPKTLIKHPIRIMDFEKDKLFKVDYINDDSTGNKRGEEKEVKEPILPMTHRVNYSVCKFKNKVYIYGGMNDVIVKTESSSGLSTSSNQILNSMEIFEAITFKFTAVKYRGDLTPQGRQGHAAVIMNQYAMVVIGGTYQDQLIDPTPVPENDSIWSFDLESCQWQRIKVKNQGAGTSDSTSVTGADVVPWNLVHHQAFKLDAQNIGVIWYDPEVKNDTIQRNMMISVFNCKKCLWKNLKLASMTNDRTCLTDEYRFGTSVFPIVDLDCDRVNRVLIFGGINIKNPAEQSNELYYAQLDFTANIDQFRPLESMEKQGLPAGFKVLDVWQGEANPDLPNPPTGKKEVKTGKKFKEDEE